MSDTKWTPGPWEWYSSNSYNRLGTADDYSVLLYAVTYRDGVAGIEWKNSADAHLIAAAPELYEALEELFDAEWMVCNDYGGKRREIVIDKAEAALKKARGES